MGEAGGEGSDGDRRVGADPVVALLGLSSTTVKEVDPAAAATMTTMSTAPRTATTITMARLFQPPPLYGLEYRGVGFDVGLDLVFTPRIHVYTKEIVDRLVSADQEAGGDGTPPFCNLPLRPLESTCYAIKQPGKGKGPMVEAIRAPAYTFPNMSAIIWPHLGGLPNEQRSSLLESIAEYDRQAKESAVEIERHFRIVVDKQHMLSHTTPTDSAPLTTEEVAAQDKAPDTVEDTLGVEALLPETMPDTNDVNSTPWSLPKRFIQEPAIFVSPVVVGPGMPSSDVSLSIQLRHFLLTNGGRMDMLVFIITLMMCICVKLLEIDSSVAYGNNVLESFSDGSLTEGLFIDVFSSILFKDDMKYRLDTYGKRIFIPTSISAVVPKSFCRFGGFRKNMMECPKMQMGSIDCAFYIMRFMEAYDGNMESIENLSSR
ncbi:hypothetical protein OsI_37825 [Oryza sativa Indica Group]|uniref:Ubiquitin-like protease family profile domain-containing protein n=1 Tax=Oryza sativa subsp. indica TaxID=39946 RepID=B8BNN4_ORYSI|nr:hypothetical protein OsI_37825 [Oryza sativa Indica Group]